MPLSYLILSVSFRMAFCNNILSLFDICLKVPRADLMFERMNQSKWRRTKTFLTLADEKQLLCLIWIRCSYSECQNQITDPFCICTQFVCEFIESSSYECQLICAMQNEWWGEKWNRHALGCRLRITYSMFWLIYNVCLLRFAFLLLDSKHWNIRALIHTHIWIFFLFPQHTSLCQLKSIF